MIPSVWDELNLFAHIRVDSCLASAFQSWCLPGVDGEDLRRTLYDLRGLSRSMTSYIALKAYTS